MPQSNSPRWSQPSDGLQEDTSPLCRWLCDEECGLLSDAFDTWSGSMGCNGPHSCHIKDCPKLKDRVFVQAIIQSPVTEVQETSVELAKGVLRSTWDLNEDISCIWELGLKVDDDWEPSPKNITTATTTYEVDPITSLFCGQSWGWDGNCQQSLATPTKQKAGFQRCLPQGKSLFSIFQRFIPLTWFEEVCIKKTSFNLEAAGEPWTKAGEMICYLGLKLLMATMVHCWWQQW